MVRPAVFRANHFVHAISVAHGRGKANDHRLVRLLFTVVAAPASAADARVAEAAKQRDAKTLKTLIAQRVDVNAPQPDGATALHWAVYWNDAEAVDLLLRAGANVNASNDLRSHASFLASDAGQAGLVSKPLAAGASSNAVRATGESPLMAASRSGSLAAVPELAGSRRRRERQETTHDQTALMWAAASRHADIVEASRRGGRRTSKPDRWVRTGRTYLPADRNGSGNTPEEHARFQPNIAGRRGTWRCSLPLSTATRPR